MDDETAEIELVGLHYLSLRELSQTCSVAAPAKLE